MTATTGSLFPDLAPVPSAPTAPHIPPEARGKIGAHATALGIGTKADENIEGSRAFFAAYPSDRLLPMPTTFDPSWTAEQIATMAALSERMATAGDNCTANLWRTNLTKPRSQYANIPGFVRMTEAAERNKAAKARSLTPVEPAVLYTSVSDFIDTTAGTSYPVTVLPSILADRIVAEVNRLLRAIAQAGFANRLDVNVSTAPMDVVTLSQTISNISGATIRVINQIGHLRSVSRLGQTAHVPMTLSRRVTLVNAALAQLADNLGGATWTATSLDLLTEEVRQAWLDREAAEPLPTAFPRNLFDWATPNLPLPETLSDSDLARTIQQHEDLDYVTACRTERNRRTASLAPETF